MNCLNCDKPLSGNRTKFCSRTCNYRHYQNSDKGKAVQRRREQTPERHEYKRQYAKTPAGKAVAKQRSTKRKNREKGVLATFTNADWEKALEYFNNKCAYCGKADRLDREHFVPVTAGGGFVKENIVPSCRDCNLDKRAKNPIEWIAGLPNALIAYARITMYLRSA